MQLLVRTRIHQKFAVLCAGKLVLQSCLQILELYDLFVVVAADRKHFVCGRHYGVQDLPQTSSFDLKDGHGDSR